MDEKQACSERPSRAFRETDRYRGGAKALGRRVQCLRVARGLSLYQAAELADMDFSYLCRLEGGALNATLATLMRLADAFGVSVAELVKDV